jgi:hypothetical protein
MSALFIRSSEIGEDLLFSNSRWHTSAASAYLPCFVNSPMRNSIISISLSACGFEDDDAIVIEWCARDGSRIWRGITSASEQKKGKARN